MKLAFNKLVLAIILSIVVVKCTNGSNPKAYRSFITNNEVELGFSNKNELSISQQPEQRPIRFGYSLGLNYLYFSLQTESPATYGFHSVVSNGSTGFHVGAFASLRLSQIHELKIGSSVVFAGGGHWKGRNLTFNSSTTNNSDEGYYEALFLELPIHFKFKPTRTGKYNIFGFYGLKYSYAFDEPPMVINRTFGTPYFIGKESHILIRAHDVHLEFGLGVNELFKTIQFGIEIKYSMGLLNLAKAPGFQYLPHFDVINSLNSRGISISFTFQ